MNLLLLLAQLYIPGFYKKKKLDELYGLTAKAFSCQVPDIKGLSHGEMVKKYALFTKEKAEDVIKKASAPELVKERLYHNAFQLGEKLRNQFHLKSDKDVLTICKILYKILPQMDHNVYVY